MIDIPRDILEGPAQSPPPGVTLVLGRTSREQHWYSVCIPLYTIIPGLLIMLRFYTKTKVARKVDLADWTTLIAFILFLVDLCLAIPYIRSGAGVHFRNLRVEDLMQQLLWLKIGSVFYCAIIFLIRTAIVLQYLQMLVPIGTNNKLLYYGGRGIIIAMLMFYTTNILLTLISFNPQRIIWQYYVQREKWPDYNLVTLASALLNIMSDYFILFLPIQSIRKLRIKSSKKRAIVLLFATGLLLTIASLMRLLYVIKIKKEGTNGDAIYQYAWIRLWTWAEVALGIIVSCTLVLPRLIRAKSKELRTIFSFITRPFIWIETWTTKTKTDSKEAGKEGSLKELSNVKAPKTKEYVHAPPGLTLDSDGGSFVIHGPHDARE